MGTLGGLGNHRSSGSMVEVVFRDGYVALCMWLVAVSSKPQRCKNRKTKLWVGKTIGH